LYNRGSNIPTDGQPKNLCLNDLRVIFVYNTFVKYLYLIFAGILISSVHFYLVWHHRNNRRYSISEHAILTRQSQLLYFVSHVVCDIFFMLFSYQFFIKEHHLLLPFYLNVVFAVLDFIQAFIPSRNKTEKIHFAAAYISWVCFLLAGIVTLFLIQISEPYKIISEIILVPILGMFFYMHINRSKLYPYQLSIVPLFVIYMLFITIGAA
jgi:hypothetical protein